MTMFVLRDVAVALAAGSESYAGRWGEAGSNDMIPAVEERGKVADLVAYLHAACPCRG